MKKLKAYRAVHQSRYRLKKIGILNFYVIFLQWLFFSLSAEVLAYKFFKSDIKLQNSLLKEPCKNIFLNS